MAVLELLKTKNEPIGLRDLLKKLGKNYSERSVRRWLAEMVQEGSIEKYGHKRSTKYQYIHFPSQDISKVSFGAKSIKILEQVRRPLYERDPVAYNDTWLEIYQPNISFYIPQSCRTQLYETGKRSKNEDPAGTYAHQIFNRLLIDLSYNSSRLEGNTYSLLDTERLVLGGARAEGKLDEETIMILNHKEAIRYLVDAATKIEITKQTICTLHYLLADGLVDARYAGKLREQGVRIGGSTYIPFESKQALDARLNRITEKAAQIQDPYEQSFFLLVHISYLQGFVDVNKRTARLSANIPLIKHNLVPLSFNDVEKSDYTSAMLAIYELQAVRPLLDLYLFSYLRTCKMYDTTIKSLGFDEIRIRYRQQRRDLIRHIILQQLVGVVLKEYILSQSTKLVKPEDHDEFVKDIWEDLQEIDESRIAGLGITSAQLKNWLKKNL